MMSWPLAFIGDALGYLELTIEGKQWISNLYSPSSRSNTRDAGWGRIWKRIRAIGLEPRLIAITGLSTTGPVFL